MQLKCNTLKDFSSIWQNDFLGQKGFLLPGTTSYVMGETLQVDVVVMGESWGHVEVTPVWHNLYGVESEWTPRGIFLRLITSDQTFDRHLATLA
ncbi:MAG: hypothetical protein CSA21_04955 [Deltaproteobacteria bacterium]|nr:MAG: hypothetical protein CSA21_04955 [Deltaproteobacteria bacterium]